MGSTVNYPKKQAVYFLSIPPRPVWALPLLSIASVGVFPSIHVIGELTASVLLPSSLLKIICGLCVFTQYRLAGWGCVTACTPSLGEFKNKTHICNAKLPCSPFRAGWEALAPSALFYNQFGPIYSKQGAERWCLTCGILASWHIMDPWPLQAYAFKFKVMW